MSLTDTAIKQAKPKETPYKLNDGRGLYLQVHTNGGKYWRLNYRFFGKYKTLAIGVYPKVTLKQAREAAEEALKLVEQDVDPSAQKKTQKLQGHINQLNTFEAIAREWFTFKSKAWVENTRKNTLSRLERFIFPYIGKKPMTEITPADLITVIQRIEKTSSDNAHKTLNHCSGIFKYAIARGLEVRNLCIELSGHILQPLKHKNRPAILDPLEVGHFLRACYKYKHSAIVRNALLLAPMFFVRPGELRLMKWADVDLESKEWKYITSKNGVEHHVPLSRQALEILMDMKYLTGENIYVFSAVGYETRKTQAISDGTVNRAIRTMGYDTKTEITAHGFRAMARTLLAEKLRFPSEVIEHQLAHRVPDALGTAYNRTKYIDDRTRMMQQWADYLDNLRLGNSANIIPMTKKA